MKGETKMIVEGTNVVRELVRSNSKIFKIRYNSNRNDVLQIINEARQKNIKLEFVEDKTKIATQGIEAEIPNFKFCDVEDILSLAQQKNGPAFILILDGIQDPHNFGAIIRACHCFGIRNIIIPRHDQAQVSPAVFKASAGALFYTDICQVVNLGQAIDEFKQIGFKIAAADINGDVNLKETSSIVKFPLGVIIGSEGRGIRESILERADYKLKIGMVSDIDSLNASMSCAVILYQLFSR